VLDVVERLVDLFERTGLAEHPGTTERVQLEYVLDVRVPTIEPLMLIPLSTVSKIGSLT
jgi:hypothetical protein